MLEVGIVVVVEVNDRPSYRSEIRGSLLGSRRWLGRSSKSGGRRRSLGLGLECSNLGWSRSNGGCSLGLGLGRGGSSDCSLGLGRSNLGRWNGSSGWLLGANRSGRGRCSTVPCGRRAGNLQMIRMYWWVRSNQTLSLSLSRAHTTRGDDISSKVLRIRCAVWLA